MNVKLKSTQKRDEATKDPIASVEASQVRSHMNNFFVVIIISQVEPVTDSGSLEWSIKIWGQ
jgi:hypothetical protein